ncbi:MAG: DsbE family thiol:disulfide interchange protein [Gammaproteobacteria bacterium]|nr:MAG: DsbE family thiol:disulfide interchange protein [Gammaproteobacteria bacterium]
MERVKLFLPLLIFIVLAVMLYWGLERDPNAMPSALVDRPVPAFTLPALNVDSLDTENLDVDNLDADKGLVDEQLFVGKVTLLNVWATWCPSCRIEHPYLAELTAQGVPIIGLNYKDDDEKARRWLLRYGNPYQLVIADHQGRLGLDLGVFGAPETYLIDSTGVIRFKHVGVLNDRVWQSKIAPLYQSLRAGEEKLPR